jgi:hypothetical protein
LTSNKAAKSICSFYEQLKAERRLIYPDHGSLNSVMSAQSMQLHGADSKNYRYYPKLLGECLKVLKTHKDISFESGPEHAWQVT